MHVRAAHEGHDLVDTHEAPTADDLPDRIAREDGVELVGLEPVERIGIAPRQLQDVESIVGGELHECQPSRTANPNTVFAAAGDLIGASTFTSFIQQDVPTIEGLNAAGLEVSADVVVLHVHEGAVTTSVASATDPATRFGKIVNGANPNIDAIVSGHTHLAYNHVIAGRPVISSGQYGERFSNMVITVDPTPSRSCR